MPVLAVAFVAGCGEDQKSGSVEAPPVFLAKVGDSLITVEDFDREVQRRRVQGRPIESKEALLQELIDRKLIMARARSMGLDQDPSIRREVENLLIGKLRERQVAAKANEVEVTTAELQDEYNQHLAQFTVPEKVRLAILFKEVPLGASPEKRLEIRTELEKARELAAKSKSPAGRGPASTGFAQLAVRHSDHQISRYRGGDIGWLEKGNFEYHWDRALLESAYALERGEFSPVLEGAKGLYVVTKTDLRDGRSKPFEEVESALRSQLLTKKRREVEARFLAECRSQSPVEIRSEQLAEIKIDPSGGPGSPGVASTPPSLPGSNLSSTGN